MSSLASRKHGDARTEKLGLRRGSDAYDAAVLLQRKIARGHERVRTRERKRREPKGGGGDLDPRWNLRSTAADGCGSGEQNRRRGRTKLRGNRGERWRGTWAL